MGDAPERVVVERVLPGTPDEVYAAWTTPETLRRFMCPGEMTAPVVEADVRVGGAFRIVMRGRAGDVEHRGEYRVLEAGRRLVFTWASPPTGWTPTLVTIELSPHEDGTRLVLVHEGLPTDEARRGHRQGWTSIVEKLGGLGRSARVDGGR
jgi:uncharacterized protein YndB with AHSA1/START domain